MGAREPGQGRKSAAISGHSHVWRASRSVPIRPALLYHGRPTLLSPMSNTTTPNSSENAAPESAAPEYVVVARRYRPMTFDELIGQEHIARALSNAITTNRVGHAYLFTGARGVGKTSAARILAKALNCEKGPAPLPCNECEICESISGGDDIDVLEIDGASNRGIDEIRQLRQNVGIRPSRARLKIYIIDEVHMLTREAFNALLKTLEEPPEHVKFIFCTTDPNKIPVTILSRCQRFDFAGIVSTSIAKRLQQIVELEGVAAEPEAIGILARRATGSMRDGQSLLEQLLAFAPENITVDDVNNMLGTAGEERLMSLLEHLLARDSAAALAELDGALTAGVDSALLLEQLFGYLRDCMTAAVGCGSDVLLYASPGGHEQIVAAGNSLGLQTILAAMQILEQTLSRLRQSTQARILAELALVRICALEDLDELSTLVAQVGSTAPLPPSAPSPAPRTAAAPVLKKKAVAEPGEDAAPPQSGSTVELTADNSDRIWEQVLAGCSGLAVENARQFDSVAISAPNRLVVSFKPGYTLAKSICEKPEHAARFQAALSEILATPATIEFRLLEGDAKREAEEHAARTILPQQRNMEAAAHPFVRHAEELFGAQPTRVFEPKKE